MSPFPRHDRRSVLKLLGALAAGAFPLGARAEERSAAWDGDVAAAIFADPLSAGHVGRAYLALVPEEADPAVLRRRLELPEREATGRLPVARDALLAGLHARMREDFRQGRVVHLDGWVLSRTEARLCALAALTD